MRLVPLALIAVLALVGAATGQEKKTIETLPASRGGQDLVGTKAPRLKLEGWLRETDEQARPKRGAVTLYRWWTDGCPYCEASLPGIDRLRRTYGDRGLSVVAVYHPKPPRNVDAADVEAAAKRLGFDGVLAVDADWSELRRLCGGTMKGRTATSMSFLVDGQGVLRFVHPGPVLFPSSDKEHARENADYELLERAIVTLLEGSS
jgi:thiol-disulfide isomerase/thioredoxin